MAVSGDDPTQEDIPGHSGLEDAIYRLRNVPGVIQVRFTEADVVRHDIVQ